MTPLGAALKYAVRGWPVFPCDAQKIPRTKHGFKDATTVERQVREWWSRWPYALIGMPTGERTGLAVLDVDMKNGKNGLRTLARLLGTDELPVTPTAHTQTGGLHLHFRRRERGFANTAGAGGRGIGEGLDWRCDGGYVIVPAPSSGYSWDPRQNYATCSPIDVPPVLLPHPAKQQGDPPSRHGDSRSRLAAPTAVSLTGALQFLLRSTVGERNQALFWTACRFAEAVAAGLLFEDDAHNLLEKAAADTGLHDREIARTLASAFRRADW